jgi:hypothetical protein
MRITIASSPNKRLKLAGADRLKGTGVFAPWQAQDCVHYFPPAGESPAA